MLNSDGADCMVIYTNHVYINYHQTKILKNYNSVVDLVRGQRMFTVYHENVWKKFFFGFVEKHISYL